MWAIENMGPMGPYPTKTPGQATEDSAISWAAADDGGMSGDLTGKEGYCGLASGGKAPFTLEEKVELWGTPLTAGYFGYKQAGVIVAVHGKYSDTNNQQRATVCVKGLCYVIAQDSFASGTGLTCHSDGTWKAGNAVTDVIYAVALEASQEAGDKVRAWVKSLY